MTANGEMHLTPTWQRIMDMLSDGSAHTEKEILGCMEDPLTKVATLRVHICAMRRELKHHAHGILTEQVNGTNYYRLVRFISSAARG